MSRETVLLRWNCSVQWRLLLYGGRQRSEPLEWNIFQQTEQEKDFLVLLCRKLGFQLWFVALKSCGGGIHHPPSALQPSHQRRAGVPAACNDSYYTLKTACPPI